VLHGRRTPGAAHGAEAHVGVRREAEEDLTGNVGREGRTATASSRGKESSRKEEDRRSRA
jgi:hypothetical protein